MISCSIWCMYELFGWFRLNDLTQCVLAHSPFSAVKLAPNVTPKKIHGFSISFLARFGFYAKSAIALTDVNCMLQPVHPAPRTPRGARGQCDMKALLADMSTPAGCTSSFTSDGSSRSARPSHAGGPPAKRLRACTTANWLQPPDALSKSQALP